MLKIYSKVDPDFLLHCVYRHDEHECQTNERNDIIDPDHFIQCSALRLNKTRTFKPHSHIVKTRTFTNYIAQESWVVIKGRVQCSFYDIDNTLLSKVWLSAGDASFTLYGGHTYEILDQDTLVYEYKTGPYEGQEYDKIFI